jgi:HD superfamily phosphohydrolase
MNKLKKK